MIYTTHRANGTRFGRRTKNLSLAVARAAAIKGEVRFYGTLAFAWVHGQFAPNKPDLDAVATPRVQWQKAREQKNEK